MSSCAHCRRCDNTQIYKQHNKKNIKYILAWLIGDDEAYEHGLGLFDDRLAMAVPGAERETKDCALSHNGRKSRAGKQGQHRKMRYD